MFSLPELGNEAKLSNVSTLQLEKTIELVKLIESTGVAAIGVHGRYKEERSRFPCRNDVIRAIVDAVNIPVIAK